LLACLLATGATFLIGVVVMPLLGLTPTRIPVGILVMDSALTGAVIVLPRLLLRVEARRARSRGALGWWGSAAQERHETRRVLIAGAGDAGGMIAKELLENPQLGLAPIGFVDDDSTKHGHQLHGIPVLGSL